MLRYEVSVHRNNPTFEKKTIVLDVERKNHIMFHVTRLLGNGWHIRNEVYKGRVKK